MHGFMFQIPLIVVSRYFRGTRRGNVIMWMSLFAGQPLLEVTNDASVHTQSFVVHVVFCPADPVFQGMVCKPRVVFLCGLSHPIGSKGKAFSLDTPCRIMMSKRFFSSSAAASARKFFVGGNWKCNGSVADVQAS
jgi:hypothetical protein